MNVVRQRQGVMQGHLRSHTVFPYSGERMIIPLYSDERRMVGIQSQGADISLPKYTTPEQLRDDFAAAIFAHVQAICTTAPAVVDYPCIFRWMSSPASADSDRKTQRTTVQDPSHLEQNAAPRSGRDGTPPT